MSEFKSPQDVLDSALMSENGVKVTFASKQAADSFRFRCYRFIRNEKAKNLKELGDEASEYGELVLAVRGLDLFITFNSQDIEVTPL